MKTNEQQIFDELMRQKLGDYSEAPDMGLLDNVHHKKNRLIRLYGLHKLFVIACFAGLSMLGIYLLMQPAGQLNSGNNVTGGSVSAPVDNTGATMADKDAVINVPANATAGITSTPRSNSSNTVISATGATAHNTAAPSHHNINNNASIHSSSKNTAPSITKNSTPHIRTAVKNTTNSNKTTSTHSTGSKPVTATGNKKAVSPATINPTQANKSLPVNAGKTLPTVKATDSKQAPAKEQEKEAGKQDDKKPADKKEAQKDKQDKDQKTSACKAAFDYYVSYDGKFNFTNFSQADASAKMTWEFGDGNVSEGGSPTHVFAKKGTYTVTLHVTDQEHACASTLQKTLTYGSPAEQPSNIAIKGRVIGNSEPVANGMVRLLGYNKADNTYQFIARSGTSRSGEYSFAQVKPGRYLIIAEAATTDFLPTYWGNTITPEDALEVNVLDDDQDFIGYNISLSSNRLVFAPEDAHMPVSDTNGTTLLVIDYNNNIIGKIKVDNSGNIINGQVPPGEYNVINQQTGTASKISVTASGVSGAGMANGNVSGRGSGSGSTAAKIESPSASLAIKLVPNPAVNDVSFEISSSGNEQADVIIINSSGSMVYHGSHACEPGENTVNINVLNLPPGVYYVVVNIGGKQTRSGQMIKKTDGYK